MTKRRQDVTTYSTLLSAQHHYLPTMKLYLFSRKSHCPPKLSAWILRFSSMNRLDNILVYTSLASGNWAKNKGQRLEKFSVRTWNCFSQISQIPEGSLGKKKTGQKNVSPYSSFHPPQTQRCFLSCRSHHLEDASTCTLPECSIDTGGRRAYFTLSCAFCFSSHLQSLIWWSDKLKIK